MSEMTNPTTDSEEEVTDDVTADEIAESKNIDVRSLGIEPLASPISEIAAVLTKQVGIVTSFVKTQKDGRNETTDPVFATSAKLKRAIADEKNETVLKTKSVVQDLASSVAEALFTSLESGNTLLSSKLVLDAVSSIVDDLRDNHEYFFNRAVQAEKDRLGITVTPSEEAVRAKLTCIKLRDLIENRINIARAMDEDVSEFVKVSETGRQNLNTDIIPRVPKLDLGDSTPKSVNSTRLAFRWIPTNSTSDDEENNGEVDPSWTLNDVAHNLVSKGAYRVSGATIAEMLKKAKLGIGATEKEWELTFQTGTLYGKKA